MSKPYNKYDEILKRDLLPRERVGEARANVQFAIRYLETFDQKLSKLHDSVTEDGLLALCEAADNALNAAMNAAFIGTYDYEPQPVCAVGWDSRTHKAKHF